MSGGRRIVKYNIRSRIGSTRQTFLTIRKSVLEKKRATHVRFVISSETEEVKEVIKTITINELDNYHSIYPIKLGKLLGINVDDNETLNRVTAGQEGWLLDITRFFLPGETTPTNDTTTTTTTTMPSSAFMDLFSIPLDDDIKQQHTVVVKKRDLLTHLEMLYCSTKNGNIAPFYSWITTTDEYNKNTPSSSRILYSIIEELYHYFSEINEKAVVWFLSQEKRIFSLLCNELKINDDNADDILNLEKKLVFMLNSISSTSCCSTTSIKKVDGTLRLPVDECLYLLGDTQRCRVSGGYVYLPIESVMEFRIPDIHSKTLKEWLFYSTTTTTTELDIDTLAVIRAYYSFIALGQRQNTSAQIYTVQKSSNSAFTNGIIDNDPAKLLNDFKNRYNMMPPCLLKVNNNFNRIGHLKNTDRMIIVGTLHSMGYSAPAITA